MKTKWFSFLKFNKFEFGKQIVSQFVVFECKYLFSILLFYFHKSDGCQDRYHTHAFNAFSIKLFGKYTEYIAEIGPEYLPSSSRRFYIKDRKEIFKYFPRDSFHKIGNSTGCLTCLFSGPWRQNWIELMDDGRVVEYTWGRE